MKENTIELVKKVLETNACPEVKNAAQTFLDVVGTDSEKDMFDVMIAEFKADIIPIDGLIEFCSSDFGKEKLGEEIAKNFLAHGLEIKANGAEYCDCPACSACLDVINAEA